MQALANTLPKVTAKVLGKRGLGESGLLADWPTIIGSELADTSLPLRLTFPKRGERVGGTLTLRVAAGHALVLQHLEPVLIERINGYLGYAAIARLRYLQGPLPAKAEPAAPAPLDQGQIDSLKARSATIEDPDMAAALERLGTAVLQRAAQDKPD